MNDNVSGNFGLLVAYLIPGATVLWGLSLFSPLLAGLFAATPPAAPTIGGFLYLTVASLAAGMTVNAVRWALLDMVHARTGLAAPHLDFSRLGANVEAFTLLIEIHYKHYQFHANMVVATAFAYVCYRVHIGLLGSWGWLDAGVAVLEIVFFSMSRDTLRLCGAPHKRSYVAEPVMWRGSDRSSILAEKARIERHITFRFPEQIDPAGNGSSDE
jgi:hypothetical protein